MLMIDPAYVVSGFGVGLLVGMTGVGGGSLMTPLLILLFGVHPATVSGPICFLPLPPRHAAASRMVVKEASTGPR
jgi:uncharacterized membrane protein YfcA